NEPARTLGLVRGGRIGIHQVLDQVRRARESGKASVHDVRLGSDLAGPARILTARVHPMERDAVLAIVEDHSAVLRADESKRDLVANVSHELKTPVGAMQVLAETLQAAADDPEAVRHFAGRMGVESKRLGELVGQIIELSRLQSDDPLLGAHVVSVDEVVAQAASRTHDALVGHEVSFSVTGDKGLTVIGDLDQLTNAITNLVANAISYSDRGARVAVTVRRVAQADDHWVEIAVTDNGIGIAPEEQERIFERFYRVDYARSRADGGTGLGLSIVKHVVAAHGGSISLWSRPGQGSTFTVRLPEDLGPVADPVPQDQSAAGRERGE
ncbi:two-component sensor histidine kinase, partial [Propionibacterium freudenreichii]|nr:two-component sensor histidine kinase [Propionibacterium freudenreichii]